MHRKALFFGALGFGVLAAVWSFLDSPKPVAPVRQIQLLTTATELPSKDTGFGSPTLLILGNGAPTNVVRIAYREEGDPVIGSSAFQPASQRRLDLIDFRPPPTDFGDLK